MIPITQKEIDKETEYLEKQKALLKIEREKIMQERSKIYYDRKQIDQEQLELNNERIRIDNLRANFSKELKKVNVEFDNAKKEVGLSSQMLSDLEKILVALQTAEKQSTDYLNQVNSVLKGSFQQFGQEMVSQVEMLKVSSDTLLSGSLSALEGTVQSMLQAVAKLKKSE